ncbi:MAG: hypothetical protein L3J09_10895 [Flavobacteriaceae bacterium]|nr:hypothetical protein [Flavobacteriaceae bacterium]
MKLCKRQFFLLLVFATTTLFSQDYERIDATILLYPNTCESPEEISKFITRDFQTEEEKVRAIYSWIIQNIAYEPSEYKKFDYRFSNYRERNKKEEITRNKIINRTLQKGIAVCEGYAFLFEKLCELQGITNYLVRGDTKTTIEGIGKEFNTNHMWNVAIIDGKSYLFDPTWGAGKYNQKFIKELSYFYYKTPPKQFIKTHYPDIFEDALVLESMSKQEFSEIPLIINRDLLISDIITPNKGIIYTEMYFDEVQFLIKNTNPKEITFSFGGEQNEVSKLIKKENLIEFSVPLQIGVKTLLIYFDDAPALGYRIE